MMNIAGVRGTCGQRAEALGDEVRGDKYSCCRRRLLKSGWWMPSGRDWPHRASKITYITSSKPTKVGYLLVLLSP